MATELLILPLHNQQSFPPFGKCMEQKGVGNGNKCLTGVVCTRLPPEISQDIATAISQDNTGDDKDITMDMPTDFSLVPLH